MKKEYPICVRCKIAETCHPAIVPVIVGRSGEVRQITDKHKHIIPTWCGNYTCGIDGETSAEQALADVEHYEDLVVTEYSGLVHTLWVVPFGSSEKETARLKQRVISPDGQIYARQNDMYYPTQKINR